MVDFNSGYVPPGVYVSTNQTGSTAAIGIGSSVVCLVGRGLGYQTYTENVSFASANSVPLTQKGIDPNSVVVTGTTVVLGVPTPVTFQVDGTSTPHDYSLTESSGTSPTSVTTLVRTSSGTIPTTGTVTVSYHYTNATYHALNAFSDYASLANIYGPSLDPVSGAVLSPLSLAAQIAFQNGANQIFAIALSGSGTMASQFATAYGLTLSNFNIDLLVPLFEDAVDSGSITSELAQLLAHLDDSVAEGTPRVALVGVASGFAGTTPDLVAAQANSRRVVLVWPQQFNYFNPVTNTTTVLDGFYFAAACAGFLANNLPNQGLTQVQIRSFTGIPAASLNASPLSSKNLWSSKGVAVAEVNRSGQLVVRHGVTTNPSNIGNREINIVRCQDALFSLIQITMEQAQLIGTPITPQTPLTIKGLIQGALETALATNTIQDYQNLLVSQQTVPTGDPTVIQVTFTYSPTYPLNYITVVFTLDLSTGNLSLSQDTATGGTGSTTALVNAAQ